MVDITSHFTFGDSDSDDFRTQKKTQTADNP